MPRRDQDLRLRDMLHHAQTIARKLHNVTREQFDADEDLRTVVTWHLLIVGEAAARVDKATQRELPQIPWDRIVGMRNRLVHEYGNIDANIVWTTTTARLPQFIDQLRSHLDHA